MWVYVSMREGTHRGRKTLLDPVELELRVVTPPNVGAVNLTQVL